MDARGILMWGLSVAVLCNAGAATYYAKGGGTKTKYAYDWYNADNWYVDDGSGNKIAATTTPQAGDTVIFDTLVSHMSLFPDDSVAPALQKIVFKVANTIHQGYVPLQVPSDGLVAEYSGNMTWWAGLRLTGTGELPILIPSGSSFYNQKGVLCSGSVTLVKQGAGSFVTANEWLSPYQPVKTVLEGGTIVVRASNVCTGHEFIFSSNDEDLRLRFTSYVKNGVTQAYGDWTIKDGLFSESNVVDNTAHGLSSDGRDGHTYYLRLTGTPKAAEQRFTGQLYDTAGIAFLPGAKQSDGTDYVFTFAKAVSAAGGGIAVTNGTVRLVEGASFTNLGQLNVGSTGTFKVESGSGANFVCRTLDVAAGGKLNLASGVALCVRSTLKAGGTALDDGVYSATGADGSTAVDWITGAGVVKFERVPLTDPIILTVASGSTVDLATALAAYNAEHAGETDFTDVTFASMNGGADKARTLVKRGAGTLNLTNAMTSFEGPIRIEGGTLYSNVAGALGKTPNDASPIGVYAGARYSCHATNNSYNLNRIFRIRGAGPDGRGAIWCTQAGSWGRYHQSGKMIYLDGDATLGTGGWIVFPSVTLNGHTLTLASTSGENTAMVGTVYGDGGIIVSNAAWRQSGVFEGATKDNLFRVVKDGAFRFWDNALGGSSLGKWRFDFASNMQDLFGDQGYRGGSSYTRGLADNTFTRPVALHKKVSVHGQTDRYYARLSFRAPVSGEGGFDTTATYGNRRHSTWLHLLNATNSFTGGLTFNRGVIWSYANGAIPADGGAVVLNRGDATDTARNCYDGVAFPVAGVVNALPDLEVKGTYPARVQCGEGAWKSIAKSGANVLEYYSEIGAPTLTVQAGTFKLPRGAAPGLWEGIKTYSSAEAAQTAFAAQECPTNYVARGPHMANGREKDLYPAWPQNALVVYHGYVWNRTGASRTVTLASALKDAVDVRIDGQSVLSAAASTIASADVTLAPGPHAFEWRAYNGADSTTGFYSTSAWPKNFAFAIDLQGRGSVADTNNFVLATDAGDGSLFTRTTNAVDRLPAFGEMKFTAGAILDLNGNRYVAATLSGSPTVTNSCTDALGASASLSITNAFRVYGAELTTDTCLVSQVPVSFEGAATVELVDPDKVARRGVKGFTVLRAPSITGTGRDGLPKLTTTDRNWILSVGGTDGARTLELQYCAGTIVIIR